MATPEGKTLKRIVTALETLPDIFVHKVHGGPMQKKGLLDLEGCYCSYYFAIEVKAPGARRGATELQKKRIREIRKAGGIAFVTSSPKEAKLRLVKEVRTRRGNSS